ncbi:MAG: BMP family ABC transporter substrate-binding protein [Anaerolineae bacterium]|jgi:basic membrane protein A|nr:BMP family ABC transporter substrate-binding protein [Anaerolineae bacterium]
MFHRSLLMALAAIMALSLLVACGGGAEPAEQETTEIYRVALVISQLGDRSFLDSAARGIEMAKAEFPNIETKIIENQDVGEQQLAARAMAEEGYNLIITIGYGSADWTSEIAQEYPNAHFAIVDSTLLDAEGKEMANGTGLTFREDEGSFTVGMAAAMLSKTGKIGFIGGQDVPLLHRFELGYIQGARYVNPDIEVISGWVGSYIDPTKGKELALTQYEEGVDIIFAAAGKSGEGVLAASAEKDLYAIGVDSDQCYIQPGHVIASMMKMVDRAVFDTIKALVEGQLVGGTRVYGLKEEAVGMCYLYGIDQEFINNGPADMAKMMQEEVVPAVKAAAEEIKAGTMCVTDYVEVFPCDKPAQPGGMGN